MHANRHPNTQAWMGRFTYTIPHMHTHTHAHTHMRACTERSAHNVPILNKASSPTGAPKLKQSLCIHGTTTTVFRTQAGNVPPYLAPSLNDVGVSNQAKKPLRRHEASHAREVKQIHSLVAPNANGNLHQRHLFVRVFTKTLSAHTIIICHSPERARLEKASGKEKKKKKKKNARQQQKSEKKKERDRTFP